MDIISLGKEFKEKWEGEYGEGDGFWIMIVPLVDGREVGFGSPRGQELLDRTEEKLGVNGLDVLKPGDCFNYATDIRGGGRSWMWEEEEYSKLTEKERKATSFQTEELIKSNTDIQRLNQKFNIAISNLIKDRATNIGERNWKLETSQELIKKLGETHSKLKFLTKVGYYYCLEHYKEYESFLNKEWFGEFDADVQLQMIRKGPLPLNEVRRDISGKNYLAEGSEFIGGDTRGFLHQYPIFVKYPHDVIFLLKKIYDSSNVSEVVKNYILRMEGELNTVDYWDFANFAHIITADNLEIFPNKNQPLKTFIKGVELYHNNYSAWELLKNYPYLASKVDKDIVSKAFILLSNWDIRKEIEDIINEAEGSKDWGILISNKRKIQELEYKVAMGSKNKEILDNAADKEDWVKKLNIDFGDYRFRVLDDRDPLHLGIGVITDCCQRVGGAGEEAAIDSLINPLAGVLVLEGDDGGIIAQSYFHYIPMGISGHGYILDNVEVDFEAARGINLDELYHKLAIWARGNLGINFFECGTGYNKLNNNNFSKRKWREDPRHFEVEEPYSDWNPEESLNLFEYRPSNRRDDIDLSDKIEPLQRADYVEDMGRVRSDKFHGKIKELFPKKEQAAVNKKDIRRKQEGILAEMGIKNIPYILSYPAVKEITKEIVRKRDRGGNYSIEMDKLKEYFAKKKISNEEVYYKIGELVELFIKVSGVNSLV